MSSDVKYIKTTYAQRVNLAYSCAARSFKDYSDLMNRGGNYTSNSMHQLIKSYVLMQSTIALIHPKHRDEMIKLALDFYDEFLSDAMDKICDINFKEKTL